tara:strand:- start:54 stop:1022 length:969 start_codon:yes stop_codon:yes gene_type:complete
MADSDFSLDNDSMEIQNLTIDDPEIVSYFQNIEVTNENLKEKIEYLLKLGILSSKSAQMGNQTDYIDRKLTETLYKLKEHVEEELPSDESIRKIFQELLFQLGMIKGESEEHLKGTQKGFEFEEYCEKTLSSIAKMFGDRLEKTGETVGLVENSKKGDYVYTIKENDKKIVLEMKDYTRPQTTPSLEKYLNEAISNRGTDYAIVISKSAQGFSKEVGMFQEYGNKLFVALTPSDSDNSELHDELIIIAMRWARQKLVKKSSEFDSAIIQDKIKNVERTMKKFSNIKTKCTSISNISQEISGDVQELRTAIKTDLEEISKALK